MLLVTQDTSLGLCDLVVLRSGWWRYGPYVKVVTYCLLVLWF